MRKLLKDKLAMKRLFLFFFLCVLLDPWSCATRRDTPAATNASSASPQANSTTESSKATTPIDALGLTSGVLTLQSPTVCGNDQALAMQVTTTDPADYFNVKLSSSSGTPQVISFLGDNLLVGAPAGEYSISVQSCLDPNHAANPSSPCSAWSSAQPYVFQAESPGTSTLLSQLMSFRNQQAVICQNIRQAMQNYLATETNSRSQLVPVIKSDLDTIGVNTCQAMLLSPQLALLEELAVNEPVAVKSSNPSLGPTVVYQRVVARIEGLIFIIAGAAGVAVGGYNSYTTMKSFSTQAQKDIAKEILTLEQQRRAYLSQGYKIQVDNYTSLLNAMDTHKIDDLKDWNPTNFNKNLQDNVNDLWQSLGRPDLVDATVFDVTKYKYESDDQLLRDLNEVMEKHPPPVSSKGWTTCLYNCANAIVQAGYGFVATLNPNNKYLDGLPYGRLNALLAHRKLLVDYKGQLVQAQPDGKAVATTKAEIEQSKVNAETKMAAVNQEWKDALTALGNEALGRVKDKAFQFGFLGLFGGAVGGNLVGGLFGGVKYAALGAAAGVMSGGVYSGVNELINAYQIHAPSLDASVALLSEDELKDRAKDAKSQIDTKQDELKKAGSVIENIKGAKVWLAGTVLAGVVAGIGVNNMLNLSASPQSQFFASYGRLYQQAQVIQQGYQNTLLKLFSVNCSGNSP